VARQRVKPRDTNLQRERDYANWLTGEIISCTRLEAEPAVIGFQFSLCLTHSSDESDGKTTRGYCVLR